METTILQIRDAIAGDVELDAAWLDKLLRNRNREIGSKDRAIAKRRLLPYYLSVRNNDARRFSEWGISPECDHAIVRLLQAKPRRTASGVATVTVLTKPWPCGGNCTYCPSDILMPKSYMSDEPACQRAARCGFDPYVQVARRLGVLEDMGHVTDKVELIVLGGTWDDYSQSYRQWFVCEMLRALNEFGSADGASRLVALERELPAAPSASDSSHFQKMIDDGGIGYNEAVLRLWGDALDRGEDAHSGDLASVMEANETASHRCVGLVFETRPECVSARSLMEMRELGATKIQLGIQSTDDGALSASARESRMDSVREAMELARLVGLKLHVHFMPNLPGATSQCDLESFSNLFEDESLKPDEVKIYPCVMVASSRLTSLYEDGLWAPYEDEELIMLLSEMLVSIPPYARVSRMIRDISATDIIQGTKKTNLRQAVESATKRRGLRVREIRSREISTNDVNVRDAQLERIDYRTSVSDEVFLQWVVPDGGILGFLRLSLPFEGAHGKAEELSKAHLGPDVAMIREVHVYGRVSGIHEKGQSAQHLGLGKRLVEEACAMAKEAGYGRIAVISAIGTRDYYRKLGFSLPKDGLYMERPL